MSTRLVFVVSVAVGMLMVSDANAQCSRNSGGGSPLNIPSASSVIGNPFLSASNPYQSNFGGVLAMQQQAQRVQQQLLASRQLRYRQQQMRGQQQQAQLAQRLERAERTRQLRADRIARAKAERESRTGYPSSATALVSTVVP